MAWLGMVAMSGNVVGRRYAIAVSENEVVPAGCLCGQIQDAGFLKTVVRMPNVLKFGYIGLMLVNDVVCGVP